MSDFGPARKPDVPPGSMTTHRCRHCGHHLRLIRRHVSPLRLGPPLTTEFYQCSACDSGYALNPATGKWKTSIALDDA